MTFVRKLKLVSVTGIALLACSQLSFAASPDTQSGRTRTVNAADLDLSRSGGVETLYQRIQAAAEAVCREEAREYRMDTKRFVPPSVQKACVTDAIDGAVASAKNSLLSALHRGSAERIARL